MKQKEIMEFFKEKLNYQKEDDVFYFRNGNPGHGDVVFEMASGEVCIEIPGSSMEQLVTQLVNQGKGRLEIKTNIFDRKGSPGFPEYHSWESNVKDYHGTAILYLEMDEDIPKLTYELPEHDQHSWSGW